MAALNNKAMLTPPRAPHQMSLAQVPFESRAALITLLFLVLSYHGSLARPSAADCKEEWFEQRVDHFSSKLPPSGSLTWRQRFLTSDLHFDPTNGCIFFYTGNEGDVSLYANNTGLMYSL
jgi:hypothetical protein